LILRDMGKQVSGSDLSQQFLTDRILKQAKIKITHNFSANNIQMAEVVVYSGSHQGKQNPEVQAAIQKNIPNITLAALLGLLTQKKKTIAVSGCHGKTTTTALAAYLSEKLTLNSSYYLGGPGFMNYEPGKWAKGKLFFVEADEYVIDPQTQSQAKFLSLHPQYIICTNIDYDHPDVYPNQQLLIEAYTLFFNKLPQQGKLIINGDDQTLLQLVNENDYPHLTYGFKKHNQYRIQPYNDTYQLFKQNKKMATIKPKLIGEHNLSNITAVLIMYEQLGYEFKTTTSLIAGFTGVKRRMEELYRVNQSIIVDDYAHHPQEIRATLKALRIKYPKHQIAICFQPHTYSRTKALFTDFVQALSKADVIGLLPIFASAREREDSQVNHKQIAKALITKYKQTVYLLEQKKDWTNFIKDNQKKTKNWVYVTMGAGDIYKKAILIRNILQHD